jgi:hypothetical protein
MLTDEPSSTAGPGRTTVKAGRMEASALDFLSDRLETVLEDGEFVLYRSAAAHTTPAPSVLIVMPRSEHPRPQAVRMLEHEHSLRDRLDPAWALRPLALTTLEGRPALVLEDPGGELLLQRVGTPMDVADVLRVGVGMAGHSGKPVRTRARRCDANRRLRARGNERDAGAGACFRIFRHRQIIRGQRAAQSARAAAASLPGSQMPRPDQLDRDAVRLSPTIDAARALTERS